MIGAEDEYKSEDLAFQLNRKIAPSGFKLKKESEQGFWHNGAYIEGPIYFSLTENSGQVGVVPTYLLTESSMNESLNKARDRLERGDFSGSISICYTLIEEFLKLKLMDFPKCVNENEGDIKKLYRIYAKKSGLEASAETPDPLKSLLSGLTTLAGGFYEVANKVGDRHQKKFSPSSHHARLVLTLTLTLTLAFCEFIIESKERQPKN